MALTQITYNDKTNYQSSSLANEYKVSDSDMNEIKSVVNGACTQVDNLTPVTLYNSSSGTLGTVTLSDSANNYTYLEIFYGKNSIDNSVKVVRSSGKATFIEYVDIGSVQIIVKTVTISGTSITNASGYYLNFTSNAVSSGSANEIRIYRVLGYV